MESIPFLEAVGCLLYLSQVSRPDIAYAVNRVSSFSKSPSIEHWNTVKRIFRFLKGTLHWKLCFKNNSNSNLLGYSDADWANCKDTRSSVTGSIFIKNDGPISWFSKKQRSVALSTVEAEYIALSFSCQEAIWLRRLIYELENLREQRPVTIYCDNNGAICIAKNRIISPRTKHIDVRHHFIRENIENNEIVVNHIGTQDMIADLLTKALPKQKFMYLVQKLGIAIDK
ncbi:hypothetical protein KPH14_012744 [Odynerus spinipes]|uniref:Retrovirus-related Pol polyprotein from transposon TNT 1-94 n=1 Tax=Odynerus spinipes TaxID=1348599 RepID=A0AAD9VL97_9HYME|nr:hypothetical protein KPH14_012744 [Odynerus spinipes]